MKADSARRLAYIVLTAALFVVVALQVQNDSRTLTDPTPLTGYYLFGLMIFLALFNTRKKLSMLPIGKVSFWLRLHVSGGLLTLGLFWLHIGKLWPNGGYEQVLAFSFYAVNVTDRYAKPEERDNEKPPASDTSSRIDVEASLHDVAELKKYLEAAPGDRPALAEQEFAAVALAHEHAQEAERLLWNDHVRRIRQTRADEMKTRRLTAGKLQMPFYYTVSGDKPKNGRSLYISLHGGGGDLQRRDRRDADKIRLKCTGVF